MGRFSVWVFFVPGAFFPGGGFGVRLGGFGGVWGVTAQINNVASASVFAISGRVGIAITYDYLLRRHIRKLARRAGDKSDCLELPLRLTRRSGRMGPGTSRRKWNPIGEIRRKKGRRRGKINTLMTN